MASDLESRLKRAAKGLLYPSESDEPIAVVRWPGGERKLTKGTVLELGNHQKGTQVEEVPVDQFFEPLTTDEAWHDAADSKQVERFRKLKNLLTSELSRPHAFRVEDTDVHYYVIGKTSAGDFLGIHTTATET
jgi:hypothetical protein